MSKTKTRSVSFNQRQTVFNVLDSIGFAHEAQRPADLALENMSEALGKVPWHALFDAYELLETLCHEHGGQLVLRPSVVAALEHGAPDPGATDPALGQEIARYRFPIDLAAFSNANLALRDAYPNHVFAVKQIGQFGVVFARPKNGGQS